MKFKMQKILFLAFFVLVSNSGIAFTIHFCGGKLAAISAGIEAKNKCKTPQEKIKDVCCAAKDLSLKKCCSDKKINLKNTIEKFVVKSTFSDYCKLFCQLPSKKNYLTVITTKSATTQKNLFFGSSDSPPLYLLHQQFTFFG
jgi:hypothetical protein